LGLLDELPVQVQAQGGNYLHSQIADVTTSLLSFKSGVRAHVFVSWLHPFKEQKLVVVGDRKMAVFNDIEKKDKLLLYPHSIDWKNQIPVAKKADAEPVAFDAIEPLRAECQHFLDRVLDRQCPRTDGREGLRVLKVLQLCQQALESGNAVKLETSESKKYKVHESAWIDEGVVIGEGTVIWHVTHVLKGSKIGKNCKIGQNVVIGPKASIGDGVKIQNNISIYEGVTIEDDVFCGPAMVFTNVINPRSEIVRSDEYKPTLLKKGATIGANATIVCGHTIGRYAFVGAGAVVTKDVPDYALVIGNPARVSGWMCACGVKLKLQGDEAICEVCGQAYRKSKNGLSPSDSLTSEPRRNLRPA
jgi:UDP-2-acetamido-3-amino-2,3-dideoxy-glucuronate N-acetyltransferase